MPSKPPAGAAYAPALYEKPDVAALQALQKGQALDHQQQRALRWIIEKACGTYDLSFRPDSERETAFAEGKRFVGLQIVKLLNLNLANMREQDAGNRDPSR